MLAATSAAIARRPSGSSSSNSFLPARSMISAWSRHSGGAGREAAAYVKMSRGREGARHARERLARQKQRRGGACKEVKSTCAASALYAAHCSDHTAPPAVLQKSTQVNPLAPTLSSCLPTTCPPSLPPPSRRARTCLCTRLRFWLYFIALLQMSSKSRTTSCQFTYCRPRILLRMTCTATSTFRMRRGGRGSGTTHVAAARQARHMRVKGHEAITGVPLHS